jgi:biotin carboxylase
MAHVVFIESNVSGAGYRALDIARNMGHSVTFVARNPNHYYKGAPVETHPISRVDRLLVTDTNNISNLLQELHLLDREQKIDAVLTLGDYYAEAAAWAARSLGLPGTDPQAVRIARNKDLTRKICSQHSIPSPEFRAVSSLEEAVAAAYEIGFPCVCKPTDQNSSINVALVTGLDELEERFACIRSVACNAREQKRSDLVLIEEYMDGPEISVETMSAGGSTLVIGMTGKEVAGTPFFVEVGHVFPFLAEPGIEQQVTGLVKDCLLAIGLTHGVCHTEVKLTSAGPKIVEVNARPAGDMIPELIAHAYGVHLIAELIRLQLGLTPDLAVQRRAGAAIRFLASPTPGVLAEVRGQEEAASMPGIMELQVTARPGDPVKRIQSSNERLGYIIGVGNSPEEAEQRVRDAGQKIELVLEEALKVVS